MRAPRDLPAHRCHRDAIFRLLRRIVLSVQLIGLSCLLFGVCKDLIPVNAGILADRNGCVNLTYLKFRARIVIPHVIPSARVRP